MTRNTTIYKSAITAFIISAVFSLFVAFQMITSYTVSSKIDPANFTAIEELRTKLKTESESDVLKDDIRNLDMLVRGTHFKSLEFSRIGAFLLLGGAVIMLLSFKLVSNHSGTTPSPGKYMDKDVSMQEASNSRRAVFAGLILIAIITVFLGITSTSPLDIIKKKTRTFDPFQSWPAFRGPMSNGRARFTDVPTSWDGIKNENILWKTPIPLVGYSSPIVAENKVFITGSNNDSREVYCFDALTGEALWTGKEGAVPGAPAEIPEVMEDTGYAACTMTTDGSRLFAAFGTDNVVCFDMKGNRLWSRYMGDTENMYGYATSLIAHDDLLFIQYDHSNGAYVFALDTATGDIVWKNKRDVKVSWSSPILAETENGIQLILNGHPHVKGYEPATGKELWSIECMDGELASSPAYADGIVFVANEYAKLIAIKLGEEAKIIWEYTDDLPDVSSPAASDKYLFMASGTSMLSCFDTKTGALHWSHEFDDGFFSSPVIVGDLVYILDKEGVMQIVAASDTFKLINSCPLGEQANCTAAFMDKRIYIRSNTHLYCISN